MGRNLSTFESGYYMYQCMTYADRRACTIIVHLHVILTMIRDNVNDKFYILNVFLTIGHTILNTSTSFHNLTYIT